MDAFLYFLQMFLSYAIALAQIVMYIFVVVFLAKVSGPAVKALKAYIASKDNCACGCGCTESTPAIEEPKAE